MNIYQKMAAVTAKMKPIAKNLTIGYGKYAYKAVAEADILNAVKKLEEEFGIYSYPADREIVESRVIHKGDGEKQSESQFIRMATVYRFVNTEAPEEFVEVTGYGDGIDSMDKAPGKAMTYSDKYALMKAYKIETGDDPDIAPSDPLEGHDILAVKKRVRTRISTKMAAGMDIGDIYARLGINEKQMKQLMDCYDRLHELEQGVNAL